MTDQELLTDLQYALLEPPDGGAAFPSGLWTRDEVLDACDAGQRLLVRNTQLVATRVEIAVGAGDLFVTLPTDWLATLHAVWRDANGRAPLSAADAFEADLVLPTWEGSSATPLVYLDDDTTTLRLRLAPTPLLAGTLELLYVANPTVLTGHGTALTVPDEYASAAKYTALATLLNKPTRAFDPERATYANERADLVRIAADLILAGGA